MTATRLDTGWILTATNTSAEGGIPERLQDLFRVGLEVEVPGTVHSWLLRKGLLDDPRTADHEAAARWVGWTDFTLSRTLEVPEQGEWILEFDGIDTFATIFLDDQEIGRTRNAHRRYRFRVPAGRHNLRVELAAPEVEALAAEKRVGPMPNAYHRPYNAVRKTPCNFGWDWGPDFPSSGLWRDVRLVDVSAGRIGDVLVDTVRTDGNSWRAHVRVQVESRGEGVVRATVAGQEAEVQVADGTSVAQLSIDVEDPALWMPHTHGQPHLHELTVELTSAERTLQVTRRIGFREVWVERVEDEAGESFGFVVNGQPVFVRGVNWIPDSCFPAHPTDVAGRFTDAIDAHCNLIRVWGGGTYESTEFYQLADEQGLLVWQDFNFACGMYSEAEELHTEVRAEAYDNILRLQAHPSLVLWNGNNENLMAYEAWDLQERMEDPDGPWGATYYFETLPQIVAELDPRRPYIPGSPFSREGEPYNSDTSGCTHVWDVWNGLDFEAYHSHQPRFAAEFGYQGPPMWRTLADCVGERHMTPSDPVLLVHQKAGRGNEKLERGMASHGGVPEDPRQWWWKAQHIQAVAFRVGILHLRALMPHCQGSIIWQLNDCWPVISWAIVDDAGRRKPAWHAVRQAHQDRTVAFIGNDEPTLHLINDHPQPWRTEVIVEIAQPGSQDVQTQTIEIEAPARAQVQVPYEYADGILRARTSDGITGPAWFHQNTWGAVGEPEYTLSAERTEAGWEVTVEAASPVVDAVLWSEQESADAAVEEQLVTLLPGESFTFHVSGGADIEDWTLVHLT